MSCNCQKCHYCDCCCKCCCPGGGLSPLTSCSGYGYDDPCNCQGPCGCNPEAISDEYDYGCRPESINEDCDCNHRVDPISNDCACNHGSEPYYDDEYDCRPRRRRRHGLRPIHTQPCCSCVNALNYGCCTNATTWGRCQ